MGASHDDPHPAGLLQSITNVIASSVEARPGPYRAMRFHGVLTLLTQAKPGAALPASAVLRRSDATFERGVLTAHAAAAR